jgi:hypothetical protein
MSTDDQNDPLDQNYSPDRLFYSLGRMLSVDDFRLEQTYHRGRLARALAYLHGSGTVAGLKVDYKGPIGPDEEITVAAGMAIDRLGRIIEVPRQACIRLDRWYRAQTVDKPSTDRLTSGFHGTAVIVDVFITFVACERGKTPAFAAGPFDATDAISPSTIRDGYRLDLVIRTEASLPTPGKPWGTLPAGADIKALNDAVLAGWHEGTEGHTTDVQENLSVFLARVSIPATAGSPPVRSRQLNQDTDIDNYIRPFLYTPEALARVGTILKG